MQYCIMARLHQKCSKSRDDRNFCKIGAKVISVKKVARLKMRSWRNIRVSFVNKELELLKTNKLKNSLVKKYTGTTLNFRK